MLVLGSIARKAVGDVPDGPDPSPAFKDLADARFDWQNTFRGDAPDEARVDHYYVALRKKFEKKSGKIEREYWADRAAMAVVVTAKKRPILRLLGLSPKRTLHRSTEAASLPFELEAALADGDTLATKAVLVLNAGSAETVLSRVFEAHKFLLSAVDAEMNGRPDWPSEIRRALREKDGSQEAAPAPTSTPAAPSTASTPSTPSRLSTPSTPPAAEN